MSVEPTPTEKVFSVAELKPGDSSEPIYDAWAESYDQELTDVGYNSPPLVAATLAAMVGDTSGAVIDYGCGTGLSGSALRGADFETIDGADLSSGMLEIAAAKGVYRSLHKVDLTGPTGLGDGSYAAAACVGAMGNGHLDPSHVTELVRAVTPGGPVVFYMNGGPYVADDYEGQFRGLADEGVWTIERIEASNYMDELARPGFLVVARAGAGT
ncbi:MAG: methyltransferase domain-containing protein [Acidimicrobiales bacterium]|jgi:SAM-dependent methyltransferase|nr:methyltransferase domain-containing protein [Acidimicrobiales bacterium]